MYKLSSNSNVSLVIFVACMFNYGNAVNIQISLWPHLVNFTDFFFFVLACFILFSPWKRTGNTSSISFCWCTCAQSLNCDKYSYCYLKLKKSYCIKKNYKIPHISNSWLYLTRSIPHFARCCYVNSDWLESVHRRRNVNHIRSRRHIIYCETPIKSSGAKQSLKHTAWQPVHGTIACFFKNYL